MASTKRQSATTLSDLTGGPDPQRIDYDDLSNQPEAPVVALGTSELPENWQREEVPTPDESEVPDEPLDEASEQGYDPDGVPTGGAVNPDQPSTDVGYIKSEADALADEAVERNLENENVGPVFERVYNSIGFAEVFLRRTGEAVAIELSAGTYRIYPYGWDNLNAYELQALDVFEDGKDRVSGR